MQSQQCFEVSSFVSLCKKINSKFSLGLIDKIEKKDPTILNVRINPDDYSSATSFANDYLVANFLSKWKGFSSWFNVDTRGVAINSWTAAELKCFKTNSILKSYGYDLYSDHDVGFVFREARAKIHEILGTLDLAAIFDECEWTSGATADTKYGTPLAQKMSKPISVTPAAMGYLRACVESDPHWASCFIGRIPDGPCSLLHAYKIRHSNRLLTVPKSAKTDRVIAAEPAGNIFLQRGIGIYIRNRLARYGIRLSDQSHNQRLASIANVDRLATIDLKAASDTISIELVRALLPSSWFEILNSLRCRYTRLNGTDLLLNKFSSMGNAFTFELETLIFYCLSYAVALESKCDGSKVSAYGDDIICPQAMAPRLINILGFCGFDINVEKSFISGRFFESCGRHYFDGFDVSPIYQKEVVSNLQEQIRLYNRIYRWGCTQGDVYVSVAGPAIRRLQRVFKINPKEISYGRVPAIPRNVEGDDGYLVSPSWLPIYNPNSGFRCTVYVYRSSARPTRAVDALLAYKLRRSTYSNDDPKGHEFEIDKTRGVWQKTKRWIHNWESFYQAEKFG